ncbi:TPA: hypothetical protein ACJIVJ_002906 [Yersinia enterocolitica]
METTGSTTSKERPILFNAEMVNAILSGRKTQTRRIMKVQPEPSKSRSGDYWFPCNKMQSMVHVSDLLPGNPYMPDAHEFFSTCCPLGGIGDQLWVRECFRVHSRATDVATLVYRASERNSWTEQTRRVPVSDCNRPVSPEKWTPSIHMPRWASRINLLITGVRVERLQAITLGDICKEIGCSLYDFRPATYGFQVWEELWKSIYGEENWQANPWVWVIEFERMEAK